MPQSEIKFPQLGLDNNYQKMARASDGNLSCNFPNSNSVHLTYLNPVISKYSIVDTLQST